MKAIGYCLGLAALIFQAQVPANAQEKMQLAVGQRGAWDTAVPEIGARAGIFKKYGLDLEILYTQGGGETQQAVISGSVDVGVAAGVMGVLGAYSKGAPVRVIGAEQTGLPDMYFYVVASSPIKSIKDATGKSMAYSTNGSSTHSVVTTLIKQSGLAIKPVATGNQSSTLTQVMSGQVDIGWSAPPFGLAQMEKNEIRVVARGSDAEGLRDQTVRLLITHPRALETKRATLTRFMKAYRETVDFMYAGDEVLKIFADFAGTTVPIARRTRDDFFPKSALDPDTIAGLDDVMTDAVTLKYMTAPLSKDRLNEMIQLMPK
jgi:NitT/TauT family transport system substrate-binding protein